MVYPYQVKVGWDLVPVNDFLHILHSGIGIVVLISFKRSYQRILTASLEPLNFLSSSAYLLYLEINPNSTIIHTGQFKMVNSYWNVFCRHCLMKLDGRTLQYRWNILLIRSDGIYQTTIPLLMPPQNNWLWILISLWWCGGFFGVYGVTINGERPPHDLIWIILVDNWVCCLLWKKKSYPRYNKHVLMYKMWF